MDHRACMEAACKYQIQLCENKTGCPYGVKVLVDSSVIVFSKNHHRHNVDFTIISMHRSIRVLPLLQLFHRRLIACTSGVNLRPRIEGQ